MECQGLQGESGEIARENSTRRRCADRRPVGGSVWVCESQGKIQRSRQGGCNKVAANLIIKGYDYQASNVIRRKQNVYQLKLIDSKDVSSSTNRALNLSSQTHLN